MKPRVKAVGAWLLRFPFSIIPPMVLSPEERGIARALRPSATNRAPTGIRRPVALDAGAGSQRHRKSIESLGYDYQSLELDNPFSHESPSPDFVGSIEAIPCRDGAFDAVFSMQVLEHVRHPQSALREVARVLKARGKLILTTNFMYPRHGSPHDYFRFTPEGLESLCNDAGLRVISITGIGGLFAVLQYSISAQLDALGRFAVLGRGGNRTGGGPDGAEVSLGISTFARGLLFLPFIWILNLSFLLLVFPLQLLDFMLGRAGGLTTVGYSLLAIKD